MHARFILSDLPSIDSVHGIAVYDSDGVVQIRVSSRLMGDVGLLGIHRAVDSFTDKCRVSKEKLEANTDQKFKELVKNMCDKYKFEVPVSLPE